MAAPGSEGRRGCHDMNSTWRTCLLAMGLASVWGCGPPEVAPALPPGVKPVEVIPEDQQAQALGEQAGMGAMQPPTNPVADLPPAEPTAEGEVKQTAGGVKYQTLKAGDGPQARAGQRVRVHYVGKLLDGQVFEDSRKAGQSLAFRLGVDNLIQGWHQGITGMKVGEVRQLTIPPELGYGREGREPMIPPNATLVFDIELLGVEEAG